MHHFLSLLKAFDLNFSTLYTTLTDSTDTDDWYRKASDHLELFFKPYDWLTTSSDYFTEKEKLWLTQWHQHAAFASVSSKRLVVWRTLELLKKQLIAFEKTVRSALATTETPEEAKKLSVFVEIIKNKHEAIDAYPKVICASMLARLQSASLMHDIFFDDIILNAYELGQRAHLLPKDCGLPDVPKHELTKKLWYQFHENIFKYGTEEQKNMLYQCSWFHLKNLIPTKSVKGVFYPVPVVWRDVSPMPLLKLIAHRISEINLRYLDIQKTIDEPKELALLEMEGVNKKLILCQEAVQKFSKTIKKLQHKNTRRVHYWRENKLLIQLEPVLHFANYLLAQAFLKFLHKLQETVIKNIELIIHDETNFLGDLAVVLVRVQESLIAPQQKIMFEEIKNNIWQQVSMSLEKAHKKLIALKNEKKISEEPCVSAFQKTLLKKLSHVQGTTASQRLYWVTQWMKIQPKNPESWFVRGEILFELKRYQDALTAVETAIRYHYSDPQQYWLLGRIYDALHHHKYAQQEVKKFLVHFPHHVEARALEKKLAEQTYKSSLELSLVKIISETFFKIKTFPLRPINSDNDEKQEVKECLSCK